MLIDQTLYEYNLFSCGYHIMKFDNTNEHEINCFCGYL